MKNTILLVGSGQMAIEYAKVLKALQMEFIVVGRGETSATVFKQNTGILAIQGGIETWLKNNKKNIPLKAIVAVNEELLGPVARMLILHGFKSILIEKPGGINLADLEKTQKLASQKKAKVFVAYNRRFYASAVKARELIKQDGGVLSFTFDFTERSHLIQKLDKSPAVKKEWLLANSSHVIDLAFFLGGKPKKINSFISGKLTWHPKGAIYTGSGISKNGALFSYHANWKSAGNWNIEILTPKRKLIFRPLEKLKVQEKGSMSIQEVPLADELDLNFKPGLYRLTQAFLGSKQNLVSIKEQVENTKTYNQLEKKT